MNRLFVKSPIDDVVVIDIKLNLGSINEEYPGLGNVLIPLWRSSRPYLDLERMGASLSLEKSFDFLTVRVKVRYEQVNKAVKLIDEFLMKPNVDKLNDAIREVKTWIQVSREDTATRAFAEAVRLLFRSHPYSRHPTAYEYDYDSLTKELIIKTLDKIKVLSLTTVAKDDVVELNIPPGDYVSSKPTEFGSGSEDIRLGGKVQATVAIVYPTYEVLDLENSFTMTILNTILGGMGLVSRLYKEVRVKRGLAYYAYSSYIPLGSSGIIMAMAGVRRDALNDALRIMQETIMNTANNITEDELKMAVRNRIGKLKITKESPEGLASLYSIIPTYKLPTDYYEKYIQYIEKISINEVMAKARQLASSKNVITIAG